MSEWLLGIDAGGSSSTAHAAVRHAAGDVRGRWTAGPANLAIDGIPAVVETLLELIRRAEQEIDGSFEVIAVGIAGAGSDESCRELQDAMSAHLTAKVSVTNDGELLLIRGGPGPVVAVIAGTGSLVLGRQSVDTPIVRAGGWGPLLGDDGSAYSVVRDLLRRGSLELDAHLATARLQDLLPRPGLVAFSGVLRQLGVEETQDYKQLANDVANRKTVAKCFGTVLEFAENGDSLAGEVVNDQLMRLADQVFQVASRAAMAERPMTLVLAGGALVHHASYREQLVEFVGRLCQVGEMIVVEEPADGALMLAARCVS